METGQWTQDRLSIDSNAPPYSPENGAPYKFTSAATQKRFDEQFEGYDNLPDISSTSHGNILEYKSPSPQPRDFPPLRPNRRVDGGVELGNKDSLRDSSNPRSQSRTRYSVNPMIHNWRSPLGKFELSISHLLWTSYLSSWHRIRSRAKPPEFQSARKLMDLLFHKQPVPFAKHNLFQSSLSFLLGFFYYRTMDNVCTLMKQCCSEKTGDSQTLGGCPR